MGKIRAGDGGTATRGRQASAASRHPIEAAGRRATSRTHLECSLTARPNLFPTLSGQQRAALQDEDDGALAIEHQGAPGVELRRLLDGAGTGVRLRVRRTGGPLGGRAPFTGGSSVGCWNSDPAPLHTR